MPNQSLPAAPRRTHRTARDAGTRFERKVADHLATVLDDDRIDRRPRNGAKDRGDIGGLRAVTGERIVAEVKDVTSLALAQWVREARTEAGNDDAPIALVIHKRRGIGDVGQAYVTMTVDDLARLLGAGAS